MQCDHLNMLIWQLLFCFFNVNIKTTILAYLIDNEKKFRAELSNRFHGEQVDYSNPGVNPIILLVYHVKPLPGALVRRSADCATALEAI